MTGPPKPVASSCNPMNLAPKYDLNVGYLSTYSSAWLGKQVLWADSVFYAPQSFAHKAGKKPSTSLVFTIITVLFLRCLFDCYHSKTLSQRWTLTVLCSWHNTKEWNYLPACTMTGMHACPWYFSLLVHSVLIFWVYLLQLQNLKGATLITKVNMHIWR